MTGVAEPERPEPGRADPRRDRPGDLERELTVRWEAPAALAAQARRMDGRAFLEAIRDGTLPRAPIQHLLGFELVAVDDGRVVFAATPGEQHYNPIGVVHGGVAGTLLDSAMGAAVHSTLPLGSG
jgi:hypothetical protein